MHDFFHMGGYALYVWSPYGLGLIVLVLNIIIPLRREKKLLKSIAAKTKRKNSSRAKKLSLPTEKLKKGWLKSESFF